jgi:rSAM/selenodomain-associated transferase 1
MTRTIVVIAKEPVPGRVKTRLCPPCTPEQAAHLAERALAETLQTVAELRDVRPVLALDGGTGPWLPAGVEVVAQQGEGLDERLAGAFAAVGTGGLLIGMDTPQVTGAALESAFTALDGADAVLGPCDDGGWWAVGLHEPDPRAFLGVPMSSPQTFTMQLARLHALGLATQRLPRLRDVDHFDDALAVADVARGSRFAAAVGEVVQALTGSRRAGAVR